MYTYTCTYALHICMCIHTIYITYMYVHTYIDVYMYIRTSNAYIAYIKRVHR